MLNVEGDNNPGKRRGVEALAMALQAVADEGERVIFEVVLQLGKRPVAALVDNLWVASKVECLHAADGDCEKWSGISCSLRERTEKSQSNSWSMSEKGT